MSTNLLSVQNAEAKYLKKSYNLEVQQGDIILLVGHNGSGKSTLIKLITGQIKASQGKVINNGAKMTLLSEIVTLPSGITGLKHLENIFNLRHLPLPQNLLLRYNLPLFKNIETYSKGNRQKLGLFVALYGNQNLVILDEPLSGLDKEFMKTLISLIRELLPEKAFLISTHQPERFKNLNPTIITLC
jgi:ABC-type multidrug transport system ATPase subunit